MMRLLVVSLTLTLGASFALACGPSQSAEGPQGPNAATATGIIPPKPGDTTGVDGRPLTLPVGMGGSVNLGSGGTTTPGTTAGGGTGTGTGTGTGPGQGLTLTGVNGTVPAGTLTGAVGGAQTITPVDSTGAPGTATLTGGILDNGTDGRQNGTGQVTGGTINLVGGNAVKDPATGVITFSGGNGKVAGATNVAVSGGSPVVPGSATGVEVPDGKSLPDSNAVYGEN